MTWVDCECMGARVPEGYCTCPGENPRWVAYQDDRLVVRSLGTDPRRLTLRERLAWRLFRKVPK